MEAALKRVDDVETLMMALLMFTPRRIFWYKDRWMQQVLWLNQRVSMIPSTKQNADLKLHKN